MDRKDYYFRQKVTEAELDAGFADAEQAIWNLMSDHDLVGIVSGGGVSEASPADLTVDVGGPMIVYDQQGRRVFFNSTQNLDLSTDEDGAATAVGTAGNEKWLSIFAAFDRALSDSRTDGNGSTVQFERAESFSLNVVQGAEASSGNATRPSLRNDEILLADVLIVEGQSQIQNADISTTRREHVFVISGSTNTITQGRVEDALADLLSILENYDATNVSTSGAGNLSAADVQTNLNELEAGTHGTKKLAINAAQAHSADATWDDDIGGGEWTFTASGQRVMYPLPLHEGDRLVSVTIATVTNGTAMDVEVFKVSAARGAETLLDSAAPNNTPSYAQDTITPNYTVEANTVVYVRCTANEAAGATAHLVMEYDHP